MNETLAVIMQRRSIRNFQDRPISRETMEHIIEAGLYAPTGRNTQARHFLTFLDRAVIDTVTAGLKQAIAHMKESRYKDFVGSPSYTVNYNAPAFVVVSCDPEKSLTPQADAAVALENMFLAARSLDIGSCWINQLGAANDDGPFMALMEKLGLPKGFRIYGSAAFGYPMEGFPGAHPIKGQVTWIS